MSFWWHTTRLVRNPLCVGSVNYQYCLTESRALHGWILFWFRVVRCDYKMIIHQFDFFFFYPSLTIAIIFLVLVIIYIHKCLKGGSWSAYVKVFIGALFLYRCRIFQASRSMYHWIDYYNSWYFRFIFYLHTNHSLNDKLPFLTCRCLAELCYEHCG